MEHEDFVTYEQAVKLKELGFDWECDAYYYTDTKEFRGNISPDNHNYRSEIVASAPTLAQAQKWLREVKKLCICSLNKIGYLGRYKYQWLIVFLNENKSDSSDPKFFDTYEQALSAGMDIALELLIQQNNGNQD